MIITSISPSRRPDTFWLKFTDGYFLPVFADDLFILKLKSGNDITPEQFENIKQSSANFLIKNYALRQIAISPKSRLDLVQKLKQYSGLLQKKYLFTSDITSPAINTAINYLEDKNLLSEEKYVDYFQKRYPKKSIAELNYLLAAKGIKIRLTSDPEEEIQKIKNLIQKKYSRVDLGEFSAKNNLISKLYRKGFPINYIKSAIDSLRQVR